MTTFPRKLTDNEVSILKAGGCSATDWSEIVVCEGFDPDHIQNVQFGGKVRIGRTGSECAPVAGHYRTAGIYNASIYNCNIGDNVYISRTGRYIAGYDIGDNAVIENVGEISSAEGATFGYGVDVAVINEAGGREVPLSGELTAQTAYITAMYRHRKKTTQRMKDMTGMLTCEQASKRASIGRNSHVVNTTSVIDVTIGEYASVDGPFLLKNGTVLSSKEHPSKVGPNVSAIDFIMAHSASLDTGAMIRRSFIGEGVVIENGFSAENSIFFANSHCSHGEACAIFAGPFTVTHHRSTLLIAGYFSFFNAGSGANQSNHMYKAGPVHQGVHLRGCKFSSDAYILLPARTGAFSIVKGRHYTHHDTDDMPFSYLIEEDNDSYLYPAMNLKSYGLSRDIKKWPNRDKRDGIESDIINYDMMSPYVGIKVMNAIEQGEEMLTRRPGADVHLWKRVKIKASQLKKGIQLYRQIMRSYIGETLKGSDIEELKTGKYYRQWVDMAGMIAPKERVDELLDRLDDIEINSLPELRVELAKINSLYGLDNKIWALHALAQLLGKETEALTAQDLEQAVEQGEKETAAFASYTASDAARDSAPLMAVGYGIDAEYERDDDFRSVRGV